MQRIFIRLFTFVLAATILFQLYVTFSLQYHSSAVHLPAVTKSKMTLLLLPLDSRPPCTQFVEKLAAVNNITVLLPPAELLDHYQTPAKVKELRAWLITAIKNADVAIISTDMLIHGGLIASRQKPAAYKEMVETLELLKTCHQTNPKVPIYVFHIIPRLLGSGSPTMPYLQQLQKYSILKDETLTFENQSDIEELAALEQEIPPDILTNYVNIHQQASSICMKLIHMTEEGVFSGLVLGQDDAQPFGLPNIEKNKLANYIAKRPNLTDKLFITRGTDEVALTLLAHIAMKEEKRSPRIFVQYSDPKAPATIMPYMPHSVAKTVFEKISLIGGTEVSSREQADFILFVHIGTAKTAPADIQKAASQVKDLLDANYKVALVDLSNRFDKRDTLFPQLLSKQANVYRLIAYAGWNTTSNSIGTALSEGCLVTQALDSAPTSPEVLAVYKTNIEFITARFLDDWFYEKDIQPYIVRILKQLGIDQNNLSSHYDLVNSAVQTLLSWQAFLLFYQTLYWQPLLTCNGEHILVTHLTIQSELPWSRVFEVKIIPTVSLAHIN
ncbi:MAG: hypothetical protein H6Q67_83 [Firmicutes bacterium]|nr:hypothetical protein [Bacillota bacterium]